MSIAYNEGRFTLVTLNHKTGAHTIHNQPAANFNTCVSIAQSMGTPEQHTTRILMRAHNTDNTGDETWGGTSDS